MGGKLKNKRYLEKLKDPKNAERRLQMCQKMSERKKRYRNDPEFKKKEAGYSKKYRMNKKKKQHIEVNSPTIEDSTMEYNTVSINESCDQHQSQHANGEIIDMNADSLQEFNVGMNPENQHAYKEIIIGQETVPLVGRKNLRSGELSFNVSEEIGKKIGKINLSKRIQDIKATTQKVEEEWNNHVKVVRTAHGAWCICTICNKCLYNSNSLLEAFTHFARFHQRDCPVCFSNIFDVPKHFYFPSKDLCKFVFMKIKPRTEVKHILEKRFPELIEFDYTSEAIE